MSRTEELARAYIRGEIVPVRACGLLDEIALRDEIIEAQAELIEELAEVLAEVLAEAYDEDCIVIAF